MYCKALLFGIVALAVLHVGRGSGLNVTLRYNSATVPVGDSFNFTCAANGTTDMVNFNVTFSNHALNDPYGRLTWSEVLKDSVFFILDPLLSTDNGMGIMCVGNAGGKSGESAVVPLNVLFPPTFKEGQDISLTMINKSLNYNFTFTIVSGNPNTTTVKLSSSPPPQDNVRNVTNNKTVSMFEITNATLDNSGNYSATVNNSFGETTLTYNVFVGGPLNASKFTITCSQRTTDGGTLLLFSCNVVDENPAPAVTLVFTMPGLDVTKSPSLQINEIPVNQSFPSLFNTSLEHVLAGYYDLEITATNGLSVAQVEVYNQNFFVAGLDRNVTISPNDTTYRTLGSGKNFTFSCALITLNQTVVTSNITLLIDGDHSGDKFSKVTNDTTETGIFYSYSITNYTDDQTVFTCQYSNGSHDWLSPDLDLTVFYGPQYGLTNMSELNGVNGTEFSLSVGLIANPPVDTDFTWTLNGNKLSNSSNVRLMPGDLQFSPLLVESEGNYTVKDCNNISCESLHFEFAVYYTPLFVGDLRDEALLAEIATGKDRNLTCTVAKYNGPEALNLTVSANPNIPIQRRKANDSSITVVITEANSTFYPVIYSCLACCGDKLCSYLNYSTYVGGAPDDVTLEYLNVSAVASSGDEYSLNFVANFTDYSEVPVTGLKYVINQTNVSGNVPAEAPMTGISQQVRSTQSLKQKELGGGPSFDLDVFAVNDLGSKALTVIRVNVTVGPTPSPVTPSSTVPSTPAPSSHGAIIAVSILVPLAVIIFFIIAVVGGYYYYTRHRRPKTYQRINAENADIDDASGGIYGST